MFIIDLTRGFLPGQLGASTAAALAAMAPSHRVLAWLRAQRLQARAAREVLRMAGEVSRTAARLEHELASVRGDPRSAAYRDRCAQLRARADLALAGARRVRQLRLGRLLRAMSRLSSDARRLHQCRQDLQTDRLAWELARSARGRQADFRREKPGKARAWA
ncbi:hypothetical protein [Ramlibacter sp. AN1133]|uniref:hypothetical protein n=1 Tax=Ramlibacter sp. AN1133 TaxID=3133429 RepID=UPI0030BF0153